MLICALVFTVPRTWGTPLWNATTKTLTISGSFAKGTSNNTDNEAYSSFCASYSDVEHIVINGTLTSTTSNDFQYFFAGLKKLKDITGLQYIDWASATSVMGMFRDCESLERIDFSNISRISANYLGQMFRNCKSLKEIDFSHTLFPYAQHMDNFLNGCTSLISADFSGFVGNTVIGMGLFMNGCTSLRIVNMPDFVSNNLQYFDKAFYNCTSLRFINIPKIRTSNLTMVDDCFSGMTGTAKVWVNYPANGATKIANEVRTRTNFIKGSPNGDLKFKLPGGTVTLSQTSATYNGSAITTPTVTNVTMGMYDNDGSYDSGIEVPSGQYTVGYSNNTNAGQAVVTVTPKSTVVLDDYGATTANFTITPKDVTVSGITANSKVYDGTTTATLVTTGAAFSGKVGSDALTISATGTFSDANAGTNKTVTLSGLTLGGSSANDYKLASSGQQTTTTASITPAAGTLTFNTTAVNKTYGDATFQNTGTVNGDGTVGYSSNASGVATVSTDGTVTIKGVGTAVITASVTGNSNYSYADNNKQYTVNVGKKALTVTAKPKTITYGDAPANDGVTYSAFAYSESSANLGGTLAYEYNYSQYGDKGNSYTITPKGLTSNNYDITFSPGTLTVNAKQVGLEWANTSSLTYNGSAQKPSATAIGTVNGDAITVSVTGEQTAAGTGYTATASSLSGDKAGNYVLPETKTTTFSIGKKALTVTAEDKTMNAGGNTPELTYTSEGLVSGDSFTGALTRDEGDAVGSYTIKQGTLSAGNNYDITFTPGTLTILRALGIEFNGGNRKWATYFAAEDLTLPEGMSAYTVKSVSGGTVTLSAALPYIPANVGVLLSYETSKDDFAAAKYTGTTSTYTSLLRGATTAQTMEAGTNYVLYNNEFVRAEGSELAANRCYLHLDAAAPALVLAIDGSATSIGAELGAASDDAQWFTLDGRKLTAKPARKGLYIKNGTKVVIK